MLDNCDFFPPPPHRPFQPRTPLAFTFWNKISANTAAASTLGTFIVFQRSFRSLNGDIVVFCRIARGRVRRLRVSSTPLKTFPQLFSTLSTRHRVRPDYILALFFVLLLYLAQWLKYKFGGGGTVILAWAPSWQLWTPCWRSWAPC